MKTKLIRLCVNILSTFVALVVPFACFIMPVQCAILEHPLFLLFYILTIPLAFVWYTFIPRMWRELKVYLIDDLVANFIEEEEE